MKTLRILIADDHALMRAGVHAVLTAPARVECLRRSSYRT